MEPPERAGSEHTDNQDTCTNGNNVIGGVEIGASHMDNEKVGDHEVRKSKDDLFSAVVAPACHPADQAEQARIQGILQKSLPEILISSV